jgi:hypothetical protein
VMRRGGDTRPNPAVPEPGLRSSGLGGEPVLREAVYSHLSNSRDLDSAGILRLRAGKRNQMPGCGTHDGGGPGGQSRGSRAELVPPTSSCRRAFPGCRPAHRGHRRRARTAHAACADEAGCGTPAPALRARGSPVGGVAMGPRAGDGMSGTTESAAAGGEAGAVGPHYVRCHPPHTDRAGQSAQQAMTYQTGVQNTSFLWGASTENIQAPFTS